MFLSGSSTFSLRTLSTKMAATLLVGILCILAGWLGFKYAQAISENKRLSSLANHQKVINDAMLKAVDKEHDLYEKLKKISEADNEKDLNDIYNGIVG